MELATVGDSTVLGEVPDTVNRPAPSLLLDAIKLFQRSDFEAGVKTVRDAIKETTQLDVWEKQWPRVSFSLFGKFCNFQVYPLLLDLAADKRKQDESRLMALHCLRDAVDVKPDLMVSTAEEIVEKVTFQGFTKNLKYR